MTASQNIKRVILVFLAISISGCSAEPVSTNSRNKVPSFWGKDPISQILHYERELDNHPNSVGAAINLSMLYALSTRLDENLDPQEKRRREDMCINLVQEHFDEELFHEKHDYKRAVYFGSVLAQNYMAVGAENNSWQIFKRLKAQFSDDEKALSAISAARDRLEDRAKMGYPFDTPNPWKQKDKKE